MNTSKISLTCRLAVLVFAGSLLASCCGNASKEKSCAAATEETQKPPIDMNTKDLFMLFDQTPPIKVNDNVTRRFAYLNDLMIVIVDIENGPMAAPDPFHSHVAEQVSYVAEGETIVIIGDKKQTLKAGDIFIVPSNVPHTVQSLTPKLRLVDTFNPIREDFLQK